MSEEIKPTTDVEAVINQPITPTKLQIVPNWKSVFFTWSFAFHLASVILTFIEQLLPFVGLLESTMSTQTYSILMFVLNGLGLLSRFVKQKNLWAYRPPKE